ncbi:MAG TPA: DNRLRE domain-containing protein [Chthoniobacteraceae bacterium]|nr:DNRLRE domain-containing protein [Chthoniobacteraceae bacterium]
MPPPRAILTILLLGAMSVHAQTALPQGAWVNLASDGRLLYTRDALGNRVLDFGDCGYKAGREPIPVVPVKVTLTPDSNTTDDTARIQAAIDQIEALTPDANGLRGAVLLTAGEYQVASQLNINASGVVLRGEGASDMGTRLRATTASQYTLVSIAGSGSRSTVGGTTHNITDKYVPVGSRSFSVDSTSGLAVGNTVVVFRPSTQAWIDALGMNQLANPWQPGDRDVSAERVITRIEGTRIFIDAPITTAIEAQFGGGQIYKYSWSGRIQQCGVEDLKGISNYNGSNDDESHAWIFISVEKAQDSWVRNVVSQYFGDACVSLQSGAKWVSVLDSQCIDPVSQITGGRRYAFNLDDAHLCLVRGCYTRDDRHQYVTGSGTTGPHAFVSSTSDAAHSDAGPHHRWASGILWDRIDVNGNSLNVQNRGNLGTGHGWAGGNCVVWNSSANSFVVQNPPTARNWLIGSIGTINSGSVYVGPHDPGTYDNSGSSGTNVFPSSLWGNQRDDSQDAPSLQVREYGAGDFDSFTADAGETTPVDSGWQTNVAGQGTTAGFDELTAARWRPWTHTFTLTAGDTILSATLWVSLRATGSTTSDRIYFDSLATSQPLTDFAASISSTGSTVIRIDLASYLSLLADGKLNLAVKQNVAVDWSCLELRIAPAPGGATQTLTLAPEADATVRGGTFATTNFGSDATLTTKEDSSATFARHALLRWDLSGVTGKVRHAKVRLIPVGVGESDLENAAAITTTDTWTESGVNWNNQPAAGTRFVSWNPQANAPVEFNVTTDVLAALAGDGKLSVQLFSVRDVGGPGNTDYASKENATVANRPQLIITVNVTATPSQQWRLQYFGIADDTGNAADLFDFDNDGFANLLERALGGNPTTTTAALIQAGVVNNKLTINFTRSTANTDLTLTVQGADTPDGPWTDLARSIVGAAFVIASGATVNESGTGATRAVQAGDLYATNDLAHPRRFMRVQVQR